MGFLALKLAVVICCLCTGLSRLDRQPCEGSKSAPETPGQVVWGGGGGGGRALAIASISV